MAVILGDSIFDRLEEDPRVTLGFRDEAVWFHSQIIGITSALQTSTSRPRNSGFAPASQHQ